MGRRPGLGAWQVKLTEPLPAIRVATLGPDERFEPGIHPDLRARYGWAGG